MIADLHTTHATEPTPIFWQAMLAHNRDRIVADVRAGLDWSEPKVHTEPDTWDDDRPGMMRVHIAQQRGHALCKKHTRAELRILAHRHGVPTGYRLKYDLAVALAFAGVKP